MCGVVWSGVVLYFMVWYGVAVYYMFLCYGEVLCDIVMLCTVCCDMTRCECMFGMEKVV